MTAVATYHPSGIADAVADSWDNVQLVLFDKQVHPYKGRSREEQTPKEVVLEKMGITSQNVQSQDVSYSEQVSIRIRYR